jgi:hypothetical protein
MKYCQGTSCHEYRTKDRIRGTKGNKSYQTRRRSHFYYGKGNFCSLNCQNDWLNQNIEHALNHFGRLTEPKKVLCSQAWYKDFDYRGHRDEPNLYYLKNDLLDQRIAITQSQYNDKNFSHASLYVQGIIPIKNELITE